MSSMLVQVGRRSSGAQLGTGGSSTAALDHKKMQLHCMHGDVAEIRSRRRQHPARARHVEQ